MICFMPNFDMHKFSALPLTPFKGIFQGACELKCFLNFIGVKLKGFRWNDVSIFGHSAPTVSDGCAMWSLVWGNLFIGFGIVME